MRRCFTIGGVCRRRWGIGTGRCCRRAMCIRRGFEDARCEHFGSWRREKGRKKALTRPCTAHSKHLFPSGNMTEGIRRKIPPFFQQLTIFHRKFLTLQPSCLLILSLHVPSWRNGRRARLKIEFQKSVGSSPTGGTNFYILSPCKTLDFARVFHFLLSFRFTLFHKTGVQRRVQMYPSRGTSHKFFSRWPD